MKEQAYKTKPTLLTVNVLSLWNQKFGGILLVFNNNFSVWLAMLVIWPQANKTKVDKFLSSLATDNNHLAIQLASVYWL